MSRPYCQFFKFRNETLGWAFRNAALAKIKIAKIVLADRGQFRKLPTQKLKLVLAVILVPLVFPYDQNAAFIRPFYRLIDSKGGLGRWVG